MKKIILKRNYGIISLFLPISVNINGLNYKLYISQVKHIELNSDKINIAVWQFYNKTRITKKIDSDKITISIGFMKHIELIVGIALFSMLLILFFDKNLYYYLAPTICLIYILFFSFFNKHNFFSINIYQ